MNTNTERGEGLVSNILAIAGFIILIVIIIWGAFHFLNLASSGFSALLNRTGASAIVVTAPKTVQSGQPLDISWKYAAEEEGVFAVMYQCREGLQFRIPLATSTSPIPCGSPFSVGPKTISAARLIPVLSSGTTADVPVSVMFMSIGTSTTPVSRAQGNVTVTVTAGTTTPTTATPNTEPGTATKTPPTTSTPTPTVTTPVSSPKPSTPADLAVRILSIGVVDPMTGMIVARQPLGAHETVAVTFDIRNQGGTSSGTWYFSAQLPTNPATPYVSPAQRPLGPGDRIENTLRFNQAMIGGIFTVTVDPTNIVRESNEGNNSATQSMVGYGTYPQPYGY